MNAGVLGTGQVGAAIATALTQKGINVRMGSRTPDSEGAAAWVKGANNHATQGDFEDAAAFGDVVFLCLNGAAALDVVKRIDPTNVAGKVVIDVTNPLDFSRGMPPRMLEGYGNSYSLSEAIQDAWPGAFVVKALNTMNYKLMVDPRSVANGDHNLFLCGNSPEARNTASHFFVDHMNWKAGSIIDLGSLQSARALEAIVPFWVLVYQSLGTPLFNFKVVQ